MEEIGLVKEAFGTRAVVLVQRHSGCDACSGSSMCGSGDNNAEIEAENALEAKAGDRVRIIFRSVSYLKGVIMVYGIPSVMLIIGALIGREALWPLIPSRDPDAVSAAAGFAMFVFSFALIRILSKRLQRNKRYMAEIVEVIK